MIEVGTIIQLSGKVAGKINNELITLEPGSIWQVVQMKFGIMHDYILHIEHQDFENTVLAYLNLVDFYVLEENNI